MGVKKAPENRGRHRMWKYRTSLRLPERAVEMADLIMAKLGLGDRTDVIRKACMYGLEKFQANPALLRRVDDEER